MNLVKSGKKEFGNDEPSAGGGDLPDDAVREEVIDIPVTSTEADFASDIAFPCRNLGGEGHG